MIDHLPSNGRLRAFRRVVLRDGVVALAGEQPAIGSVCYEGVSYGDAQAVHLREGGATALVACLGEVKAGAKLFAAKEGLVSGTGKVLEGVAGSDSIDGKVELRWGDTKGKAEPDAT